MGGFSEEREISLLSGANVCEHLDPKIFEVFPIDISETSWECILDTKRYPIDKRDFSLQLNEKVIRFDVVFNAIHFHSRLQSQFQLLLICLSCNQQFQILYSSYDHFFL